MANEKLKDELARLIQTDKSRTLIGRLREVYDEIETAMNVGVKRVAIVELLKTNGINVTLSTFDNAMHRIRKNRVNEKPKAAGSTASVLPEPKKREPRNFVQGKPLAEEPPVHAGSHDPASLDSVFASEPNLDELTKLGRSQRTK